MFLFYVENYYMFGEKLFFLRWKSVGCLLKGHWTSITSSPNFFQKSWDFYTIRSVGVGNTV